MRTELEYYHVHTMLSNIFTQPDSCVSIPEYAKVFKARGNKTLCLTEHGNRSDIFEQYTVANKLSDSTYTMKAIPGAEFYFVPNNDPALKDDRNFHLVVIGKNNEALKQLNKMASLANEFGYYRHARIDFNLLEQLDYRNFIVTTACVGGIFKDPNGLEYCKKLHDIFKENFYLEVQPHLKQEQIDFNEKILEVYQDTAIPLILGTDSHYINKEDGLLRKELIAASNIHYNDGDWDLYLPTAEEAYNMMVEQHVLPRALIEEAMENTLILREFDGVTFDTSRKFPIAKDKQNMTQEQRNYLYQKMVCEGYIKQFGMPNEEEKKELRKEMNIVLETNSADYFIGLHDMIERGVQNGGLLTKTSRGSACGFVSNAALGLTTINRLHTQVPLFAERFVTPAKLRVSMPDIDSNISNLEAFEQAGREVFGDHSCYPMIAYGKNKTLSAFKMLARSRGIDFTIANDIAKQINKYELDKKHAFENNQDDPDYNVDDDIVITDYIDSKYMPIIEDAKQYENIIVSVAPHPCGHMVYHTDLREDIGVISMKKTGSDERQLCLYMDGITADNFGYCKSDLLRVTVVKLIYNTFARAGIPCMNAEELLEAVKNDEEVWKLYERGYTVGLNQCEQPKTTSRVMRFKPKNIVELCAFVAAIRPGAKSLVDDYVNRKIHTYDIPALDNLLRLNGATGNTGKSSFLFYDENVLQLGQAAGIDPAKSYALLKHIKKKHHDEVAAFEDEFIPGFKKYLIEKENSSADLAEKTAKDIWKVILNSASYLFNASHSLAVAYDSLYGAYLKAHYPYEFYIEMLKHYTEKGDQKKIALIIDEMKRYKGIKLKVGVLGEDNRDWYVDKENKTITQNLSAIKYISNQAAEELYEAGKNCNFDSFIDVLRYLQTSTTVKKNQRDVLIMLGYFKRYGSVNKLMKLAKEFDDSKNKITKTLSAKSVGIRMSALKEMENTIKNEESDIDTILDSENKYIGLCLSIDESAAPNVYFIKEIDDKYSIKLTLYSIKRGSQGVVKVRKEDYVKEKPEVGMKLYIDYGRNKPRYIYKDGVREKTDELEYWVDAWHLERKDNEQY